MDEQIKILLVDDRSENLISLAAILDHPDYALVRAESGVEALRAVLEDDFALILMDVQMPLMDGFETAAIIKSRQKCRHIPIIFVTADSMEERLVYRGYDSGAVDYILKPIVPGILRSKVAVFADLHRKNQQLLKQAALESEMEVLRRDRLADQRYRDLVEGIHDGIVWTADAQTLRPTFVSDTCYKIIGHRSGDLIANPKRLIEVLFDEEKHELFETVRKVASEGGEARIEHRLLTGDGRTLWFATSIRLGELADQGTRELRGLSVDVTRLKQAEETARSAVQARDQFLSEASHELRTPLTSLKLQTQLLRRMVPEENRIERLIAVAESQVDRLCKMTAELLDVSRIQNGQLSLELEWFDLAELVRDVMQRYAEAAKRAGSLITLTAPHEIQGYWDRFRLDQVFTNLLTNACKYGSARPIEIDVSDRDGQACLTVRDHGVGIAAEDRDRIFARFERASSDRNIGGLGLGLYIVKQIIDAHSGEIRVANAVGGGTVFTVLLPTGAQASARPRNGAWIANPS